MWGTRKKGGGVAHKSGGWAVRVTFGAKDVREGFSQSRGGEGRSSQDTFLPGTVRGEESGTGFLGVAHSRPEGSH